VDLFMGVPSDYLVTELDERGALLAAAMADWLHHLTATTGRGGKLSGWGIRDGKAMIATLRHRIIRVPARLVSHAGQVILRPPPGRGPAGTSREWRPRHFKPAPPDHLVQARPAVLAVPGG
jgi:hypothetical protein